MVERNLAKVEVASSRLVSRSRIRKGKVATGNEAFPFLLEMYKAGWQKGYAAACKAVYAGSSPTPASKSSRLLDLFNRRGAGGHGNLAPMPEFATLLLRASEAFGAPAQLARVLGQDSHDVYRWIAGVEAPAKAKCEQLVVLLRAALAEREAAPAQQRRWSDRRTGR